MKPKEFLYMLGLRPKVRTYSHRVVEMANPLGGESLNWVEWLHPKSCRLTPAFEDLAVLKKFLKEGDFAIDVGAHIGDTTIPMALAVGRSGHVLALEPNKATFEILKLNALVNRHALQIEPLCAAAMEKDDTFEFHYNDPGLTNGGYQKNVSKWDHASFFAVKVQGIQLEKYIETHHQNWLNNLRYIKTDCEGYDYEVFKTLKNLMQKTRPVLRAEINRYLKEEQKNAFLTELMSMNYIVMDWNTLLKENRIKPITLSDAHKFQKTFDVLAVPAELEESFKAV